MLGFQNHKMLFLDHQLYSIHFLFSSYDYHNNSAEVEAILSGHPTTKSGRYLKGPSSIRSYDDRSLDEMSIHDQVKKLF